MFLHEIAAGTADRSYGVQVAKLAGLPSGVISRAKAILASLERNEREKQTAKLIEEMPLFAGTGADRLAPSASLSSAAPVDPLRTLLSSINPDELTPREALQALYRLKSTEDDNGS